MVGRGRPHVHGPGSPSVCKKLSGYNHPQPNSMLKPAAPLPLGLRRLQEGLEALIFLSCGEEKGRMQEGREGQLDMRAAKEGSPPGKPCPACSERGEQQ